MTHQILQILVPRETKLGGSPKRKLAHGSEYTAKRVGTLRKKSVYADVKDEIMGEGFLKTTVKWTIF